MTILPEHMDLKPTPTYRPNQAIAKSASEPSKRWGWLPALSLIGAIGVLLVALSDSEARTSGQWAQLLLWSGLLTLFVPIAVRLILPQAGRRERIGLLLVLGLELQLPSYEKDPLAFAEFDEFLHWRTAQDIAQGHHLFAQNPLLPVSPLYPGLEVVTNALSNISGLSIFIAGTVVLLVARLILVLGLYLFYEMVSSSSYIASIAVLLYMTNPHMLFFDADFAYESLALPLAAFVLFGVARWTYGRHDGREMGLALVIWLGLAAVVITHHLTSYMFVAFLILWAITYFVRRGAVQTLFGPGGVALLGFVMCFAWLMVVGDFVIAYLTSPLSAAGQQLIGIVTGHSAGRQLFHDYAGDVAPLWERTAAVASEALLVLALPLGLHQIWLHHRANPTILALAIGAASFPASQAFRLTQAGSEASDRATEFVFVALAFALAVGIAYLTSGQIQRLRRRTLITGTIIAVTIVFAGQVIAGSGPPWDRIPGPYLVSADARSVTPEGIAAPQWARSHLGPGNRIGTDRVNNVLMATYGEQHPVTTLSARIDVSPVFFSPDFTSADESILQRGHVRYLVVDHRLSTGLPRLGFYFDPAEPDADQHQSPLSLSALAKFDHVRGASRVFDSGNIVIYDVEGAIVNGS